MLNYNMSIILYNKQNKIQYVVPIPRWDMSTYLYMNTMYKDLFFQVIR